MAPQAPKPRPETTPRPAPPVRRFAHGAEEEAGDAPDERFGHGSGCIPVLVFRLSLLALLVWLAIFVGGLVLARLRPHPPAHAPTAGAAVTHISKSLN